MPNAVTDLGSAYALRVKYTKALAEEEAYVAGLMHDAKINHTSLPDNYWQARHRLRGLLRTTDTLIELLEETRT